MSHSPEPWNWAAGADDEWVEVDDANGYSVLYEDVDESTVITGRPSTEEHMASTKGNYARIVLAVNFCASFSDEELAWLGARPVQLAHVRGIVRQWLEANKAQIEAMEKQET